jgi:hypothetical protein
MEMVWKPNSKIASHRISEMQISLQQISCFETQKICDIHYISKILR